MLTISYFTEFILTNANLRTIRDKPFKPNQTMRNNRNLDTKLTVYKPGFINISSGIKVGTKGQETVTETDWLPEHGIS